MNQANRFHPGGIQSKAPTAGADVNGDTRAMTTISVSTPQISIENRPPENLRRPDSRNAPLYRSSVVGFALFRSHERKEDRIAD